MQPALIVIGISFPGAPEAIRKRFRIAETRYAELLPKLICGQAIDEVAVLSTSHRTEFIVWTPDPAAAADSVLRCLTRELNLSLGEWTHFHRHAGDAALSYLLSVASGIPIETKTDNGAERAAREAGLIAGIELAYREALRAGSLGRYLETVLSKTLAVAQRASGSPYAKTPEATLHSEAAQLRARLDAIQPHPVVPELRSRLERLCREELQRLGDDLGPFTREQQGALKTLAANLMWRITIPLERRLAYPHGALEEESLTKMVREVFELNASAVPESERATAGK